MDISFEKMLAEHSKLYHDPLPKQKKFDPYQIAENWPLSPILGNAGSPFIARRLHDLGHDITLERIELIKICLEAVKNS